MLDALVLAVCALMICFIITFTVVIALARGEGVIECMKSCGSFCADPKSCCMVKDNNVLAGPEFDDRFDALL